MSKFLAGALAAIGAVFLGKKALVIVQQTVFHLVSGDDIAREHALEAHELSARTLAMMFMKDQLTTTEVGVLLEIPEEEVRDFCVGILS
jgi:hypothetical protein